MKYNKYIKLRLKLKDQDLKNRKLACEEIIIKYLMKKENHCEFHHKINSLINTRDFSAFDLCYNNKKFKYTLLDDKIFLIMKAPKYLNEK